MDVRIVGALQRMRDGGRVASFELPVVHGVLPFPSEEL